MRHFQQIASTIDVLPLLLSLYRQPELWNANAARTDHEGPFSGTDDVWLRFRDPSQLRAPEDYAAEFRCVWCGRSCSG